MSDRRRSIRLAAAVSAILSAPTVAVGAGLAMALAVAPCAQAQETASQMSGFVVDAEGKPIAGAAVTIVHVPTGTTANVTTNASGQFLATGLRVGGPYRVSARAEGMQESSVEDLYTQLAQRSSVTLVAQPIVQLAGVEVRGASERDVTIGAGSRFSSQDVRTLPSISRDIKDIVRIDPKAWVDPTNQDALEIAGVNNRYNSITIDGVRQSDDFGLNNNGYPTQRSPLSIEAIQDVSILTAPFSVEYGMFRGSTINIVTKSGTNEFSGSAYYYKGQDDWAGDRSQDRDLTFTFDEETYGGTFGGPIMKDKLFFFLSYEKLDRSAPQEFGPTGSGAAVEVAGVTQAEYDQIVSISNTVYGFNPGDRFDVLSEDDEKILGKLDWNISDSQRASLSYQHTEGNEFVTSNNSSSLNRISTPSNWYNRAVTMDTMSLQLFSDWNPWFATEFKVARKEVEVRQDSLMGTDFAEMQIATPAITVNDPLTPQDDRKPSGTVFVGSDEFRHANYLTNVLDAIKLKGSFFLGDHTLMVGYEREMLDIFNIFLPRSSGLYVFSSIANYQNRTATSLVYSNAYTNVKTDGGAAFGYDTDSFYVQDEWQATPDLKIEAGVRLDKYSGSDQPLLNSNFAGRYGYPNTDTLDGRDLVMPRIGFNWQWRPETTIYGGWGLFGGGSPNVWVSNSFSGDGVTIVQQTINASSPAALRAGLSSVDGFNINAAVQANHTLLRGDGEVNAVDPDFEIPSQYRWNLGMKHTLPWDIEWTADIILSRVKDEVLWKDLRLEPIPATPTAPDGRPRYRTRVDVSPCNPGAIPPCIRPAGQDLLLTNTHQGSGTVIATDFSKTWRTRAGRFDAYLGYGFQDIKDVNSGTSSTARSNWDSFAVSDPNDPKLATSNYEIEHQFKGLFSWRKAFFGDNETSMALFAERRSGRPYSYTFGAGTSVFGDPRQATRQRALFYVPGPAGSAGDVIYEVQCTAANVTAGVGGCTSTAIFSSTTPGAAQFRSDTDAFIQSEGLERYRGKIVPRNSGRSPWVTTVDLRLAQEIPVWRKARGVVSLDIENLANMVDNDWGQVSQVSFIYVSPVLDANRIATTCPPPANAPSCYVYRPRSGQTGPTAPVTSLTALNSVWRVQLGVRFEF